MDNANTVSQPGYLREKAYLCVAIGEKDGDGYATFMQKNKVSTGDRVELVTPGRCGEPFSVTDMKNEEGVSIESAPHPSMIFKMKVPSDVKKGDILRSSDR